jgi:small subunit ribosomal protein S3
VEIKRLPIGTQVRLYVERPGMVIGRKGKSIQRLTDELEKKFKLENPQIEAVEIKNPELNGPIMAKRTAFSLERGINIRRLGYLTLRRIMNAGARGAEIKISGKVAGERSRDYRFYAGYLSKAGEPSEKLVSKGYATAHTKPGTVGVQVKVMPPGVSMPDEIRFRPKEGEVEEGEPSETGQPEIMSKEGESKSPPEGGQEVPVKPKEVEQVGDTQA